MRALSIASTGMLAQQLNVEVMIRRRLRTPVDATDQRDLSVDD